MTEIKKTPIPQRLKNVSNDHPYVAGAIDIIDDTTGDNQQEINADTYRKSETYSKEQLDNMITTPEQEYISLVAEDGDTLSDIFDGITGEADKTYRVGCWDGTQYDTSVHSEYSFDGTNFQLLSVKQPGIDNFPTELSNNFVKSRGIFRDEELLRNKIDGYIALAPFATVEGKFINSSGEEITNSSFCYQKYNVSPKTSYYLSINETGAGNVTFYSIAYFDEDGNYISNSSDLQIKSDGGTLVYHNAHTKSPSDAKYAYVNVLSSKRDTIYLNCISETNTDAQEILSRKAFGQDVVVVYNNKYFNRSQGVNAIGSMVLAKYKVSPNTKYRFYISIPENTNLSTYLISFLDANGDYIPGVSPSYKCHLTDAVEVDTEITTSSSCYYVYINIPKVSLDNVIFEYDDLTNKKEGDVEIEPSYTINSPTEEIEGKYVAIPVSGETVPEERTLASMKYSKYTIDPTKKYVIDYSITGGVNVAIVYFVDSNGDYISRTLRNSTGNTISGTQSLIVPADAAQVYINETVFGSSWVTLKEVDTIDRTSDILYKLSNDGVCMLNAGDYYISALDMPNGSTLQGCGKDTHLILSGTSDGYAIRVGARCTIKDLWLDGGDTTVYKGAENVDISSIDMEGNRHGILLLGVGDDNGWAGSVVSRCEITNFNGGGITCDNTGYGTYSSLTVSDCWIRNCCVGINIAYWSEFNKFVNVGCHSCRYGVINNGGNNSFTNCGFNSNQIGYYMNGGDNKCIRYDGTLINGRNMGHGIMSNCILDHNGKNNSEIGYAIVGIDISPGYQFCNLSIHYGKMYFATSSNISLSNVKLGQGTGVEIRDMTTPLVMSNFVGVSNSFTPFEIYVNDALVTDFDEDGNGGRVFMYSSFRYRTKATPQYLMSL